MAEAEATEASLATPQENGEQAQEPNQPKAEQAAPAQEDWKTELPDDLKKPMERFKTPSDVAKSYRELERLLGKSVQDMTPEEREKFYKRLGRPESPGGYELDAVILPKGIERNPEADETFKRVAYELNLSKEQAKKLHKWAAESANDMLGEAIRVQAKKKEEAVSALRKEWGADYDANLAGVHTLMRNFADTDVIQYLNSGPGNEPAMLKFLQRIRETMSEDTLEAGRLVPKQEEREPGMFDFSKVPEVSGENRYGRIGPSSR